jgi:hypothetical protein
MTTNADISTATSPANGSAPPSDSRKEYAYSLGVAALVYGVDDGVRLTP